MARLRFVAWAALAVAFLGVVDIYLVYRDYRVDGRLSITTTVLVWALYLLHAGLTMYAAWYGLVALPLPRVAAMLVGALVLLVGVVIAAVGVREFRSVSRMSGRDEYELVTTGVYRWSRNPQNVGWLLALAGVGIIGRSALALGLVGLFALLFHGYLVTVEEPHLDRVFGSDYRRYLARTPRYVGRFPSQT
jgi:protein-S-isoprenylcysteine O-methyltransferase Ste14